MFIRQNGKLPSAKLEQQITFRQNSKGNVLSVDVDHGYGDGGGG